MSDTGTDHFDRWREDEETAEAMIPLLGRLYREQDVILYIFGKKLLRTSIGIMTTHDAAEPFIGRSLSVQETMPVVQALADMPLDSAKIDLGKLTAGFQASGSDDLAGYLADELSSVTTGHGRLLEEPTDVVLYGFGRIGRLLARILIDRAGSGAKLRLRAIVLRPQKDNDVEKRASLLRLDSIHGPFNGTVIADQENEQLIINGNPVKFIYAQQPEDIDYTAYGIKNAIVIDNTGAWRDMDGLGRHLQATGASRAVLDRAGQGRGQEHHLRREPRGPHRGRHHLVRGQLHHQRDRSAAQGDERHLRDRRGPCGDDPRLHQRPEPHRQLPQEGTPGPFRAAQHGHHRDRSGEGGREGAARARRQADRQRHPGAGAERVASRSSTSPSRREATVADINAVYCATRR